MEEENSGEQPLLVNLASKEYSRCVERYLRPEITFITCLFGDLSDGKVVQKGTMAKMARGEMVRYMAEHGISRTEELKGFDRLGYGYPKQRKKSKNIWMEDKNMLEVGTMAPDFMLEDQDGKKVSLSDFRGKKVVLYFYSKDNTAGCNAQACAYAASYPAFIQKGAAVIGVSKDTSASHRRFADKFELPFILLSDPEKEVLQKYDVWVKKNMYGKQVMGVIRSSCLIDEDGRIIRVHAKVKPELNAGQVLADLEEMGV